MSELVKGPNVARLNWASAQGGPKSRIAEQPDGTWVAMPFGGAESEDEMSRGATAEEAAGVRIALLEELGVYVPEPPADYLARIDGE